MTMSTSTTPWAFLTPLRLSLSWIESKDPSLFALSASVAAPVVLFDRVPAGT